MLTRFIPRLLVVTLLLTFVVAGLNRFSADAAERTQWTDTVSFEDALVQACYGFNITGSYSADRAIQIVEDYSGNLVYERRDFTFTGAVGNATSGKSYAYDGQYTRTGSPAQDKFKFSNLSLRFEVGTPGEFIVSIPQVDFNLSDNPNLIVKTLVQNTLQMDMCQLFGGSAIGDDPIVPSSHPSADMSDGILELPQSVPSFDERSGKSSSTSSDEAGTCQPRRGYPQDC